MDKCIMIPSISTKPLDAGYRLTVSITGNIPAFAAWGGGRVHNSDLQVPCRKGDEENNSAVTRKKRATAAGLRARGGPATENALARVSTSQLSVRAAPGQGLQAQ